MPEKWGIIFLGDQSLKLRVVFSREESETGSFSVPVRLGVGGLGSSEEGTSTLGTDLLNRSIRGPSLKESSGHPLFPEWDLWRKVRL